LSALECILGQVSTEIPRSLRERSSRQSGAITRRQALESGLPLKAIEWKLATGTWQQVYRGVYLTAAGPVDRVTRLWAAVLAAGPGAYLSHETAAEVGRLADLPSPKIQVTIPASRRVMPLQGVVIHTSSRKAMVWRPLGIPPFTIAEETVVDLVHAALNYDDVVALVTAGFNRRLLTENDLRLVAQGRKKLRWRRELDEIITMAAGGAHSPLEHRHDRDVQRAHGLPEPVRQAKFAKPDGSVGYRDRCYPQYGGLVIELDGKRFHPDERRGLDQERDNQAAVTGSTLRYGWTDVTRRACETARQEAEALHHRGWTGQLRPCSPDCRAVAGRAAVHRSDDTLRPGRTTPRRRPGGDARVYEQRRQEPRSCGPGPRRTG
jgi:hypothetical protein